MMAFGQKLQRRGVDADKTENVTLDARRHVGGLLATVVAAPMVGIGLLGSLVTHEVRGADLLSVYQDAIESDATLTGQRFRFRADQQLIIQSRSSLRPQVGFNGRYGLNRDEFAVLGENDRTDSFLSNSMQLSVSQALYNRAARKNVDRSKGQVQLSALQLNDARQDVALRVSVAYFDVLAAQDNLEVARSEMSAISRQLDLAREMLDVGLGTKTDLFDTEARFKLAQVSEIDALNAIEDALRSLEAITGSKPGELALLNDDAPVTSADPADVEYWVSLGLARSLSVLQADQAAEIARLQTEVNRYQRSPVVNLVYNDGRNDREGPSNDSSQRDLSLQFNVPIYQGGAISSVTEEAQLRFQASQEDAKQARRETERLIRNAFLDVDSNARRIEALLQAVAASESAVQARQEGFAAGISTNLDVLDAQRDLFAARRDYLRARYNHIIDLLELERAAGTLEDENIARINQWLSSENGASIDNTSVRSIAAAEPSSTPQPKAPVEATPISEPMAEPIAMPAAELSSTSLGSTVATVARADTAASTSRNDAKVVAVNSKPSIDTVTDTAAIDAGNDAVVVAAITKPSVETVANTAAIDAGNDAVVVAAISKPSVETVADTTAIDAGNDAVVVAAISKPSVDTVADTAAIDAGNDAVVVAAISKPSVDTVANTAAIDAGNDAVDVAAISKPITDTVANTAASETKLPVLHNVGYQTLGASSVRLDIETRGPTVRAYSFAYLEPLRLAIDIYDVRQQMSVTDFDINSPLVSHVEVKQNGDHAQVIMQLTQPVHYDNTTHSGGVVIVFRASEHAKFAKAAVDKN